VFQKSYNPNLKGGEQYRDDSQTVWHQLKTTCHTNKYDSSICQTAQTWRFCMVGEVPTRRTKRAHTEQYIQHYTDTIICCTCCTSRTLHSSVLPRGIIHTILNVHRGHETIDSMRSTQQKTAFYCFFISDSFLPAGSRGGFHHLTSFC
jgi:hypothetical protein